MDWVGFWFESCHRGQKLCTRWGPDPPLEREPLLKGGVLDLEKFGMSRTRSAIQAVFSYSSTCHCFVFSHRFGLVTLVFGCRVDIDPPWSDHRVDTWYWCLCRWLSRTVDQWTVAALMMIALRLASTGRVSRRRHLLPSYCRPGKSKLHLGISATYLNVDLHFTIHIASLRPVGWRWNHFSSSTNGGTFRVAVSCVWHHSIQSWTTGQRILSDKRPHRISCHHWRLNEPFCCVHCSRDSQCFLVGRTTPFISKECTPIKNCPFP